MCLAMPARVVAIEEVGDMATVSLGGVTQEISLALVDGIAVDDYVLVHVGYALNKLSEEEAQRTLEMFEQMDAVT